MDREQQVDRELRVDRVVDRSKELLVDLHQYLHQYQSQVPQLPQSRPQSRPRPQFQSSSSPQSQSGVSLQELLGDDAPTVTSTRFGLGPRRQGAQCRTPLGEAGSCQYIFSRQCGSVLSAILQSGISPQILSYLFQAIRSPCGFQGFDFTLCCADASSPQVSTTTATPLTTTTQPVGPDGDCGVSANRNRIVGGTEARQGAWPWAVILGSRRGNSNSFQVMCGGSLLSPDTVLTAAHCLVGQSTSRFNLVVGEHDYTKSDGELVVQPASFIIHPHYNSRTTDNDFGLVRLARPVTFSERVQPVCLPAPATNYDQVVAVVSGWGTTRSGGAQPATLHEATVKTRTNSECRGAGTAYSAEQITASMICAAGPGRDSCQGDSGGPLVTQERGGYYALVGLVSWGYGCAQSNAPGVYARVTAQLDWIKRNIRGSTCPKP